MIRRLLFYTRKGRGRSTISCSITSYSKPTPVPFLFGRFFYSIVSSGDTVFSCAAAVAHLHHQPNHQVWSRRCNSSSSPITTTTMVGELMNRDYDPGHYICWVNTQGAHFDSGKAVLDYFLEILASVVGSIEEAKQRISFVSCELNHFYFGARIDSLTSEKLAGQLRVFSVTADHYFDIRNKYSVAQSTNKFSPLNWDHRLVNMSRYHESSKCNMEGDQDPGHWLIKIREPAGGFSTTDEVIDSCIDLLAAVVGRRRLGARRLQTDQFQLLGGQARRTRLLDGFWTGWTGLGRAGQVVKNRSQIYFYNQHFFFFSKAATHQVFLLLLLLLNSCTGQQSGRFPVEVRQISGGSQADLRRKEAIKKIYAIWSTKPYGFGAEIDMGTLQMLKELPDLEFLLDRAFDVKKHYGILVVINHLLGPNPSSVVTCIYWPLNETYGSKVNSSDEEDFDSDEYW